MQCNQAESIQSSKDSKYHQTPSIGLRHPSSWTKGVEKRRLEFEISIVCCFAHNVVYFKIIVMLFAVRNLGYFFLLKKQAASKRRCQWILSLISNVDGAICFHQSILLMSWRWSLHLPQSLFLNLLSHFRTLLVSLHINHTITCCLYKLLLHSLYIPYCHYHMVLLHAIVKYQYYGLHFTSFHLQTLLLTRLY